MADPYLPPQGTRPSTTTITTPHDTAYVDPANRAPVRTDRSGVGVALLVALVFVVVAVLAAVFYNRADVVDPAPAITPAAEAPATADPAIVVPLTTEPASGAEVAPAVEGGTVAPDAVAPGTADPVAPDAVAPGTADPVAPAPQP